MEVFARGIDSYKGVYRGLCISLCSGLLMVALGPVAAAQQAPSKAPVKRPAEAATFSKVSLASNSAPPGTVVVLPLYFTPAKGAEAGHLKVEVSFPSANLKFEKLARGVAAEKANTDVTSGAQTGKNDKGEETTTLTLEATSPPSAGAGKGIPAGMLAVVTLRIPAKAKPGSVSLHVTAEGTQLGSGEPLPDLRAADAKVTIAWVDAPPSVTCFFFSH